MLTLYHAVLTRSPMSLHSFSNIETGSARAHRVLELESQYMRWETSPALVNLVHQQELAVFIPSTGKQSRSPIATLLPN
jgi:hypothetical protein